MSIVAQSRHVGEALIGSLVEYRIHVAKLMLRVDVCAELMALGADPGDANVDRVIEGMPEDVWCREIARRT